MPLYLDAAKQIYNNQLPQMEGWSDEQKMQKRKELVERLKSIPALNSSDVPKEDTITALNSANEAYSRQLEQWEENTKDMPAAYREQIKPPKFSELKEVERKAELQKMGVDTDRELPTGSLEIGFGDDPVRSLKGALSEHFGQDVKVFNSGKDIIYIDPTDNKPVRANPNMLGVVGQSIPVATEIGAAVVGPRKGTLPAVLAKEGAAAGIGASTGEFIRLAIGKAMGAHDLQPEEMFKQSGIHGAWAAAITSGVGSLLTLPKAIQNFREGRVFTKKDAIEAGVPSKDSDVVIDEVNDWIKEYGGKAEFNPTLAMKSDDPLLESAEAQLRRKEEFVPQFKERDVQLAEAEKEAADIIGRQAPTEGPTVTDIAQQRVKKRVGQAEDIVEANQKELDRQLTQISQVQKETVGADTLKVIQAKDQAAKDALDATWDNVRASGGFDETTKTFGIPVTPAEPTQNLGKILERQSKTARTQMGAAATAKIFKSKKPVDLADYNREIGRLKKQKRTMSKGLQVTDRDVADLDAVIKAMEGDRRLALIKSGNEKLLKQIEDAEAATFKYHNTYKQSVIGDLTAVNDKGVPNIKSQDFVDNMLKRDQAEIDDFYEVIKDNPELINQWKQGLGDAYKRKVFPEVKEGVERYSHKANLEFINTHESLLSKFFTKQEINGFKKTGKLYEKIERQSKKLTAFKKKAQNEWGSGKLSKIDPENIVKFVTNDTGSWIKATGSGEAVQNSLKKIDYVKNITKDYPSAWDGFKNKFTQSLKDDLVDPKSGRINHNKMAEWVNDTRKAKVIEKVMGRQYYNDLVNVNKVIQMINKPMKSLAANESRAGWIQTVRAGAAPPLTRRGRAFTALLLFDTKLSHKVTANALLDQRTMHEVAKLAEHDIVSRRIIEKAFSLGLGIPDEE